MKNQAPYVGAWLPLADFGDQSMRGAYTEISRELQFWKFPLAFHVEYNGGLSYGSGKGDGYAFNNAYLGGLAYNWNSADFTKGVSVQLMYKYLAKYGAYTNSWQLTGVWRRYNDLADQLAKKALGICYK